MRKICEWKFREVLVEKGRKNGMKMMMNSEVFIGLFGQNRGTPTYRCGTILRLTGNNGQICKGYKFQRLFFSHNSQNCAAVDNRRAAILVKQGVTFAASKNRAAAIYRRGAILNVQGGIPCFLRPKILFS